MINTSANSQRQKVMRLMRTTAKANIEHCESQPTQQEIKRYVRPTNDLLLYFAALNIAITDIAGEFEDAGLYRHANKREINKVEEIVMKQYNAMYSHVQQVEQFNICRAYDYMMLRVSEEIDNCILLQPPIRAYNIAIALSRLIVKNNDQLGRFIVAEAHPIRHVIKKLERITGVEDKHIDFIIEKVIENMRSK